MKEPYWRWGEGETKGLEEELKGQYWDHPKRSPPGLLGKWHPWVSQGLVTSESANKAWGVVGQARTSTRVCSQPAGHTVQSVLLPPAQVIRPWPAELWSVSSRCQRLSCVPSPRPHPDPVLEEERWGSLGEEVSPITLPPEVRRRGEKTPPPFSPPQVGVTPTRPEAKTRNHCGFAHGQCPGCL